MNIEIISQLLSVLPGKGLLLLELQADTDELSLQYANEETCIITGFKSDDLKKKSCDEIINRESIKTIRNAISNAHQKSAILTLQKKSKDDLPVQAQITPIIADNKNKLCLIAFEHADANQSIENEKNQKARLDFFTNVSHELRTPINGIIGLTEILRSQEDDLEKNEHLESIRGCSLSLLNIINTVINHAKHNAGELEKSPVIFRIENLIQEIKQTYEPEIKSKGLKLTINVQYDMPEWLTADVTLIKQIILNLLSNATKFTDDGFIKLSLMWDDEKGNQQMVISVEDTGIGIAPEFKAKLYESFSQADTSLTRKFGGLGLGLSVTQNSVALLGGNITFESTQGKGSTFTVNIPAHPPSDEELSAIPSTGAINIERDENKTILDNFNPKGMKVLIVEDNHVNQVMMERWMKKMGFGEVHVANNGFESLTLLRHNEFDVILMDCQMPELDGYETTSLIRDMEKKSEKETPIIAVTANVSYGEREKCIDAGMNDYLTKPTNYSVLQDTIAKWLYISKKAQEHNTKSLLEQSINEGMVQDDVFVDEQTLQETQQPPTEPKSNGHDIIDMAIMDDFTEGDMDLEKQFINIFLEKGWEHIEKMQKNLSDDDIETWKIASHSLKGAAANIGAEHLRESCFQAEENFEAPKKQKERMLEQVKTEFENVRDFFKERHA